MAKWDDQIRTFHKVSGILTEHSLASDINPPKIERCGGGVIRLASSPRNSFTTHVLYGTLRERVHLEESGSFSIKLIDDALLQFMWEYRANSIIKHRYAYLPSPIGAATSADEDLLTLGERMGSIVDEIADHLCLGGAFRVDFDVNAETANHPACHLTLFGPGLEEGRLPIKGPWCLERFLHFLFGTIAPPICIKDGRRIIDFQTRDRILSKLSISDATRTIRPVCLQGPWLAWGNAG